MVRAGGQAAEEGFLQGLPTRPERSLPSRECSAGLSRRRRAVELSSSELAGGEWICRPSSVRGATCNARAQADLSASPGRGLGPAAPPTRPYVDRMMREWIDSQGGTPVAATVIRALKAPTSQVRELLHRTKNKADRKRPR